MRLVPRSRLPVAVLLCLLGAAAVGHWLYWLLVPASGWDVTDSAVGAMVFLFAPPAAAGVALVVGGGLMARWVVPGRIIATVGLGLAILYAVYWAAFVIMALEACAALPGGCGREWRIIAAAALALAVAVYLLIAVWRIGASRARPETASSG